MNLNGIGTNFVGKQVSLGANKGASSDEQQIVSDKTSQKGVEASRQKSAEGILSSMHYMGIQNLISSKISTSKKDPQMAQRIADFMSNFEDEVQKGLQVISKDFPTLDEKTANAVAAQAVFKASGL